MESNPKESDIDPFKEQNDINNAEEKEIKLTDPPIVTCIQKDKETSEILIQSQNLIKSHVYVSRARQYESDFIWKLEFPKQKLTQNFIEYQSISARENKSIHIALFNVFYASSMSASLVYVLQNGNELNEEEFKEKVEHLRHDFTYNENRAINNQKEERITQENATITESSIDSKKDITNSLHHLLENNSPPNSLQSNMDELKQGLKEELKEAMVSKGQILIQNICQSRLDNESNNNNNNTNCDISLYDDEIHYDLNIVMTLINEARALCSMNNIQCGYLIIREMQLTSNVLNNTEDNNAVMIIETKRTKFFPEAKKFTGLINEGMTCYMNSMIQALNFLGYFKRGVFKMPFESTNTVAYSLQRIFYELTFEHVLASTNQLIESFGWERDNIFVQHDVQEFNMMLSDLMEKKMQGTQAEGSFKYLFEGKIKNSLKCIDYAYSTEKEETFNDLQLNVKGCRNIYDSLNKFTEEELMDNEDMYLVEGHGKEKAKKTLQFLSLPPVLIFQLKRFEYNIKEDQMEKINDSYEFGPTLDMSKYLPLDQRNDANYVLFSILVHRGNADGGHYYSYIRPSIENNEWYCFNDSIVTQTDSFEVFNMNYGGNQRLYRCTQGGDIKEFCPALDVSAYILIYIKESQAMTLLKPITLDEISPEIIQEIINEKNQEKYEQQMKERAQLNMDIYFLSKETLQEYKGIGLSHGNANVTMKPITYEDPNYLTKINIPKIQTVIDLYHLLSARFKCHLNDFELFLFCMKNPNKVSKRQEYSMHYLNDTYYNTELHSIIVETGNLKSIKRVYIYIHINNRENTNIIPLILQGEINEREIAVNYFSKIADFIYYIPSPIKFKLNIQSNFNNQSCFDSQQEKQIQKKNNKQMVIIKQFDFANKTLGIKDMILIDNNDFTPLGELTDMTFAYYQKYFNEEDYKAFGICYFIETVFKDIIKEDFFPKSINNDLNNDIQMIKPQEIPIENQYNHNKLIQYNQNTISIEKNRYLEVIYDFNELILFKNDSFIIIPYIYFKDTLNIPLSEDIFNIYFEYKNQVFLSSVYRPETSISLRRLHNKVLYYLTDSYEKMRSRLFDSISNEVLYDILLQERETRNAYVFDIMEQLIPLKEFCRKITEENLNIIEKTNTTSKNMNELSEFPLLKYIEIARNPAEIDFEICTLIEDEQEENISSNNSDLINALNSDIDNNRYNQFKIVLYDSDNNIIADIDLHIAKDIKYPKDVIKYMYEPILRPFYGNNYSIEDFQMFINHPKKYYNLFLINDTGHNMEELDRSCKYKLKYGIIPLNVNTEAKFKIIVAFQTLTRSPLCEPLIMCQSLNITVLEMKNEIYDRIQKITKLTSQSAIISNDITKLKYYIYTANLEGACKEMLLINSKNDEKLFNLCKQNSICSILVEFFPNNTFDQSQSDYLNL